jgi:hypothetical protein
MFLYKRYSFCSTIFYPILLLLCRSIVKITLQGALSFLLASSLPRCLFGASNLILHDKSLHIIELCMNESSPSSLLPLRSLQEILHSRIKQKKGEIHDSHNKVYNDSLWTEIETLRWVLAQILMLLP